MKFGQQLREMAQAYKHQQANPPEPPEKVPLDDEQAAFLTDGWYDQIINEAGLRASSGCSTMRFPLDGCDAADGPWYCQIAAELVRRLQAENIRAKWSQNAVRYTKEDFTPGEIEGYHTFVELCWHDGYWL